MTDYSKWDNLVVSDDEDDEGSQRSSTTPNDAAAMSQMLASIMDGGAGGRGSASAHSTGRPERSRFIYINPGDNSVPEVCLCDPNTFLPSVGDDEDPYVKWCRPWGIERDTTDVMMRMMQTQMLYDGRDTPEVQFTKVLQRRKLARLSKLKPFEGDLVLDIELEEVAPRVWRRFRVSAKTPLAVLQDKVLLPLMGWTRNYHAWIFMDVRDYSVFGPSPSCTAIDMMHMHGISAIDAAATGTTLGALLRAQGETLGFCYDLGDRWRHMITVIEAVPPEESTAKVTVIDGAMQCPPEDSCGLPGMGNDHYNDFLKMVQSAPNKTKTREALRKARASCNFRSTGATQCSMRFDVFHFSKAEAQSHLTAAFSSNFNTGTGCKMVETPMPGREGDVGMHHRRGPGEREVITPLPSGVNQRETVSNLKDPKQLALCATCGAPQATLTCGVCRSVRYCDKACQRAHWTRGGHKQACSSLKKITKEAKADVRKALAGVSQQR